MNKIEITHNYAVLHLDEYPILFIGCNYQSEIVIGSFLFEEHDTLKYFHSIVEASLAVEFLKGNISYLDVLKKASLCAILTKDYNENILDYEIKRFSELDKLWLPLPTAFCPTVENAVMDTFEAFVKKPFVFLKKHSYYAPYLVFVKNASIQSNFTKNHFKDFPKSTSIASNSWIHPNLLHDLTHKNRIHA